MSASAAGGSDEFFEFLCQPCEEDNDRKEAKGFCEECSEYLCTTCIKYHKKVSKTKSHTILDDSEMPKVKVAPKSKDALTEVCPKHTDEVIKYFCNIHDCLACSVCLSLAHRACDDVAYIPDVSPDIETGQEIRQVQADLQHFHGVMAKKEKEAASLSKEASKIHKKAAADIKAIRAQVNKYLDDIQADLQRQIDDIEKLEKQEFGKEQDRYRTLAKHVDGIMNKLEEKKQQGKSNGLFIAMKQARETLPALELDVQQVADLKNPCSFNFEKDSILQALKIHMEKTWQLKLSSTKIVQKELKLSTNVRNTDLKGMCSNLVCDLYVGAQSDTKKSYISGILVLPDHCIAVADLDNSVVKLINQDKNRVTAHISLSSLPYDIALVKGRTIAVTLGKEKKVQMIEYSTKLTNKNYFSVPGTCKGIDCYEDNLFILCPDKNAVYVFNVQGVNLQTISGNWSMASRITLNENGEIFITDHSSCSVVHMSSDGRELSKFKSSVLKQPLGIAHDPQNHCIYVVGWGSNNVLLLNSSGQFVKTLLNEVDGIQNPVAVACRNGKMYVSFDSRTSISNTVGVFELV